MALCVLARGEPTPFFQGLLTPEERWLIALESWYSALVLDAVVATIAVTVAVAVTRRPCLIVVAVLVAALRIFV